MKRVKGIIHCPEKCSGNGVVVAVMDTGAAAHPELAGRFLLFRDFINGKEELYDDNGHGTHVCGIIAGKHIGMAPECKLIILKVLDEFGNGSAKASLQAFRWILENQEKYNIRIVNISLGMKQGTNLLKEKQIISGVELLWDMGVIVVAAAGNRGPGENTITIPGLNRKIITVGAYDLKNSGRGSWPDQVEKPDLVAPGYKIRSCNVRWREKGQELLIGKSGTSMATPVVVGAIANLLEQENYISNESVKSRLKASCDNLGMVKEKQGEGRLNVARFLR